MTLVHESKCGVCGAARTAEADGNFIVCEYCGAMVDSDLGSWFDPSKVNESEAMKPSFGMTKLGKQWFQYVQRANDPKTTPNRAFLEKYYYLYTFLYAGSVAAKDRASVQARRAYARSLATSQWARATDPELKLLGERQNAALARLSDPRAPANQMVTNARAALEASTAYYTAMKENPALAASTSAPAAQYARMLIRQCLASNMTFTNDPTIYDRVSTEVLGDHETHGDACPNCGAPFENVQAVLLRCTACGAVTERFADDPWLLARLTLFEHSYGTAPNDRTKAMGAFQLVGAFDRVGALRAAAFLRRAIPKVPAEALQEAAKLFRQHPLAGGAHAFAETLALLDPWPPKPAAGQPGTAHT